MAGDHYVGYRAEESIARLATRLRDAHVPQTYLTFNIVNFVECTLRNFPEWGALEIEFYDRAFKEDTPSYVTFDPLTLNVDRKLWADAKIDDGNARYVIAHEIGHIVLHDHSAKAFSNNKADQIRFADQGQSAEWQANAFAGYFLLPDHIVERINDYERIVIMCDVPEPLALDRLLSVRRQKERAKHRARQFEGGFCSNCGNFSLLRTGTLLKCTTIGCETVISRLP
jgi:hypothetical protein